LLIGSGSSPVLVDDATEESCSSYRTVERDHVRVVVGWVLVETLVWTVLVEVAFVLAEHGAGVPLVVDEHSVGALGPHAADERSA
jgi:hypothetical protein